MYLPLPPFILAICKMQGPGQEPFLLTTLWRGGSVGGKGPLLSLLPPHFPAGEQREGLCSGR